ncbi:hypothetical protein N1F78_11585 [Seonamhaeicola sp. MEBiC1930]|uniref:hypothetical protein n=1 Tax=Seonamhaeicola sp. MEBiC01930 TaxID=2976768 RepID=UPI00324899F5
MKYTKYFSIISKEYGQPKLDNYQFGRMMNIIHIEGVIQGIEQIRNGYKNTPEYTRFDLIIFKQNKKLTELTGNIKPEDLLKEMLSFSE